MYAPVREIIRVDTQIDPYHPNSDIPWMCANEGSVVDFEALTTHPIERGTSFVDDTRPDVDTLVAGIQAQESVALQTLYDTYGGQVYSLAMAVTHQRESAEEVTQDVFLRVWNKAEQYEPGTNFRAWLLRITRNVAIDYLRRSRRDWDHTFLWDVELLAETGGLSDDDARWVRRALHQLSDEQRQVIELAYLQGMTHQQIADTLHLPLGTVKTRIRDGLHKLRDVMQKEAER